MDKEVAQQLDLMFCTKNLTRVKRLTLEFTEKKAKLLGINGMKNSTTKHIQDQLQLKSQKLKKFKKEKEESSRKPKNEKWLMHLKELQSIHIFDLFRLFILFKYLRS